MQHAGRREHHHRARVVHVRLVERLDVLELEHVALHERLLDLLVGPRDKHLVVVVGLEMQRGDCTEL